MNKQEFLTQLHRELSGLPQDDLEERLTFYREMIDDRMEDGLSEEDAVAAVGSVEEIVSQIVSDTPFVKIAKERIRSGRHPGVWEIVLLILGSPLWISLLAAAFAVVLAVYVSLLAVIICLWAVFASFVGCAVGCILAGIIFICRGTALSGIAAIGAGIACAGLSIFMFYGCKAATKGLFVLTKRGAVWTKNRILRKEAAR